ncbi:hypothetical protein ANASTE_01075 [Anaerofustis stercorihominis DSM 17244]|uniref:Actin homologue MreB-like C-terminal domain-containing protein n=1 Tax=Anaerofustis stercorihominis DSM 17244 TaxID=445971 RepID=B1CAS9_9FIRM|nr:leucine-rich repeat protein [Anaerofustis stercorihominis]EDS71376.1 hypothetical protein ANASTE_01075 [Anaerofustis stercorihominis DSM 17244]
MKRSVRLFCIIFSAVVLLSFQGAKVKASNGEYTYKELQDGNIEIESYTGSEKEVVIPDEIDGKKVVSLGEYSFCWLDIEKITLNESLVKISRYTFTSLPNLKEVIFNKNLKEIGENAFVNCRGLTSVNIPQGVKRIGESAFSKCTSLENVNLSCSISTIEKYTFAGCVSLRNITMSDDITSIGDYVFDGCKELESICLPDNLKTIGESCFSGCRSLKSITIPRGVTSIGENALKGVADDFKIYNNSVVEITDHIYPKEDQSDKYVSLTLKYNDGGSVELRCGSDIIKEAASVKVGSKVKLNINSDVGNIYKVTVNGVHLEKPYEFTLGNVDYNVEVEFKKCTSHNYSSNNIIYEKATCTSIGTVTKKCIYCSLPVAEKLREFKGINMLCDIGNGTMNVMYINECRPLAKKCFTEKYGTNQCMLAVRENLMKQFGVSVDETVLERVIRHGTADISQRYLTTIRDTATEYAEGIFRRLREHEYDSELMRLYVVGGGSCILKNFGSYDKDRVIINDDICATAKGYELLAGQKQSRKGGIV